MFDYLNNEIPQYYVDEIIKSLGIDYDEDEEIVVGKRGCLVFMSDVYSIKGIIEEYLSSYCEQGKSLQEAVNHIVSSDEDKDNIFKRVRKCVDRYGVCVDSLDVSFDKTEKLMPRAPELFKIGLGYKYAPESFYISLMQSDGSYKKLDVDTSGYMWGYWLSIGEKEKAFAEVKHFLRSRVKMQRRLVTYGYYLKDSSTEYVYNANSLFFANEYNIAEKLALYKANKKHWIESNCKHHISTSAVLNGKYEVENVEKEYDEVDLSRPIKVYVKLK